MKEPGAGRVTSSAREARGELTGTSAERNTKSWMALRRNRMPMMYMHRTLHLPN